MCAVCCMITITTKRSRVYNNLLNIFFLVFGSRSIFDRVPKQAFVEVRACSRRRRGINALDNIRVQPRCLSLERDSLHLTPKLPQPQEHVHKQMRKNLLMRRPIQVFPRPMRLHGLLGIFEPCFATVGKTSRSQRERTRESWSVFVWTLFPPGSEDIDRFFYAGRCFLGA